MKQIEVVAAIINHKNKILCVQRNINKFDYLSFRYEFPGGKIEENETKEFALKREIMEELNLEIDILGKFLSVKFEYPDFKITMHSYICTCQNTKIKLTEHINFQWLTKDNLKSLDWACADIPIVERLMNS